MATWLLSRLLYKSLGDEAPPVSAAELGADDVDAAPAAAAVDDYAAFVPAVEPDWRQLLQSPQAMGSLEKLISESYKFIRMADDLHDVAQYLNDMRLCLLAVTATGYLLLAVYLLLLCMRRSRRQPRRRNWDYQLESQPNGGDDGQTTLTSARNDTYMGRNHHRGTNSAPSFMRHGLNHQTTRLLSEQDGQAVKHQIPQITTEGPAEEKAKVPKLVKDSVDA